MIPIHPIIVHFPIALIISTLIFGVLALMVKSNGDKFSTVFKWNLYFGSITSLIAAISGFHEEKNLIHNNAIHELLTVHELLGYIITGIFIVLSLWLIIRNSVLKGLEIKLILLILFIGVVIMTYSSHLGGKMVYEHGAGVLPMEEIIQSQTHVHSHDHHEESGHEDHENHNH